MGNGAGKKSQKAVQQEVPKPLAKVDEIPENRSPQKSPSLPAIPSRQPSKRDPSPSLQSRASNKRNSANVVNTIERRAPFRKLSNKTSQENDDDVSLPPLGNYKSVSRISTRASAVVPPPPINRSRSNSQSSVESSKHKHRRGSPSFHDHSGRCSKCPHCRRLATVSTRSSPQPEWLTKNPGTDQVRINMDEYDVEAVKNKIIAKNHHILGSYDYQPYLTIEAGEGDYDPTKENYYTQPFIAKMKPRVTPLRTPFPEYDALERREKRLNKPFSLPLFDD